MRKIIIVLVILMSVSSVNLKAQVTNSNNSKIKCYNTGIGLRGGFGFANGLTVKHFLNKNKAVEGILSSCWNGFAINGLYEIHANAFYVNRLNWFYGAGAHIGFWEGDIFGKQGKSYTVIGIDGIIGLEYYIQSIPFSISIDWKPTLNLFGDSSFWPDGGAISVRYVF